MIKIVSSDMFQTLVNVNSRKEAVWEIFLKDQFTTARAEAYWDLSTQLLFDYFEQHISKSDDFITVKTIFSKCYSHVFAQIKLDFNPVEAADILAYQHTLSTPYDDAAVFLDTVGKKYPICIASDTDNDMLGSLKDLYEFDNVFTSESLKSYKLDPKNRFFLYVLDYYNIEPHQIIHIGDSASDILGAHNVGINTCWLNRTGKTWSYDIKPDMEISTLSQVVSILMK